MVTAYATIETAVEAMRRGAWDYLPKPFTPAQIRHLVEKAKAQRATSAKLVGLEDRLQSGGARDRSRFGRAGDARGAGDRQPGRAGGRVGAVPRARAAPARACSPARSTPRASGAIGPSSPSTARRCPRSCWRASCSATPSGAFTGAVRDQPGRVEAAEGGTLFLDEIGELPAEPAGQAAALPAGTQFERVGETRTRKADVRVVAATNRDLEADVKPAASARTCFFRLNVIEVSRAAAARAPRGHPPAGAPLPGVLRAGGGAHAAVASRPRPRPRSRATRGRATSASCATPSSGR